MRGIFINNFAVGVGVSTRNQRGVSRETLTRLGVFLRRFCIYDLVCQTLETPRAESSPSTAPSELTPRGSMLPAAHHPIPRRDHPTGDWVGLASLAETVLTGRSGERRPVASAVPV